DRAISIDIDLRGRSRVDKAVDYAAEIGDTTADRLRVRRDGAQQQQREGEQQESDPAAVRLCVVRVARSHLPLVPSPQQISSGTRQAAPGLDSGGPAVVGPPWPVRPVTLRRHLSMALPLSKSCRKLTQFFQPPVPMPLRAAGFTPPAESRSGIRSSR